MHRQALLNLLDRHQPRGDHEEATVARIVRFVRCHADCFERSLAVGHITGSSWLINRAGTQVLLTRHRKLDMWLQLGGHADGDPDVMAVALREAREESGISGILPVSPDIFDVDVHPIPARGDVSAHEHFDIRFLLAATESEQTQISDESIDLRWFTPDELTRLDVDASIRRMQAKWLESNRAEVMS